MKLKSVIEDLLKYTELYNICSYKIEEEIKKQRDKLINKTMLPKMSEQTDNPTWIQKAEWDAMKNFTNGMNTDTEYINRTTGIPLIYGTGREMDSNSQKNFQNLWVNDLAVPTNTYQYTGTSTTASTATIQDFQDMMTTLENNQQRPRDWVVYGGTGMAEQINNAMKREYRYTYDTTNPLKMDKKELYKWLIETGIDDLDNETRVPIFDRARELEIDLVEIHNKREEYLKQLK